VDLVNGASIRNVTINFTGDQYGLELDGASASHVTVVANSGYSGPNGAACSVGGDPDPSVLTDSLCIQTGANAAALGDAPNGGDFSAVLRGVTAVATGTNSYGMYYQEYGDGTLTLAATDSIFKGTKTDVFAEGLSTGTSSITLSYCDYATGDAGTKGTITPGLGNVSAVPVFAGSSTGNFAEAAGSPTIDRGSASGVPATDTDLAGNPRTLGAAPDIGAYEALEKPTVGTPKVTARGQKVIKLSVAVNPKGLATTIVIIGIRHGHTFHTKAHSAGSGDAAKRVLVTVRGLRRHATYRFHAVARNRAGSTPGHTRKAKTK
jgi:hypothetical protein